MNFWNDQPQKLGEVFPEYNSGEKEIVWMDLQTLYSFIKYSLIVKKCNIEGKNSETFKEQIYYTPYISET